MTTLVKRVLNKVWRSGYQISFLQNLAEIAYQAALKEHVANLPVLSTSDLNLVKAIKGEGIVVTTLAALSIPSTAQMLQAAKSLMPKLPKSISGDKNEYVVHANSEQMMEYPEIFFWGLEQRLLNIVENYLGLPVAYHGAYFRRDITNEVQQKSRLWHIDTEDRKLFKIIVYLNDVNDDVGPFQYIPQSLTSTVVRDLRYKCGYIQEKTMQQVISSSNWKSCTGSSGTVIFADTASLFHRGKIPTALDRFTIFFDYSSRNIPFHVKSYLPEEDLLKLATKLSKHQRSCVFWRQKSPL